MSKELESLVARGKRVRNSREQREITFGLADISTDRNIHERLVKKGGVDTLINLLDTAQDPEAQQFAALALANTSSTGSLCDDIVKIEGVVAGLIQYVGNAERDSIGRQYCAMALGNLLSEQSTHDKITKLGCIDALIKMLANFSVGRDLEAGTNAAFAISNLSSSRCYHDKIVEKGALPLLVALSCSEDPDTQRQALFAIRGLCGTVRNRLKAIENGVLDPLILMARSKEIDIIREVSSLLNCLSSEAENKEEISYRAISTLIYLLLSDDSHIECNACSAIANLIEVTDIHRRLLEERGIPPLISLCASPDAACRTEAFRAVSNISSNNDLIEVLIQEQVLIPLVKSLDNDRDKCRFSALAIANFASNAQSLFEIVNAGAIPRLVSLVFSAEAEIEGRRYAALALANLTAYETYHSTILEYGGPEALFALSNSCDALSQHYISCALANLSCNIANHEPIVKIGGLQPMIALAHDNDQNVHLQAVAALRGFSVTGNIKMKIVQEGGLEPLCRLLLSGNNEVLRETTACLCNLSLGDENKFEISKCGAVAPLISLITSEDSVVACHACECLANLAEMIDIQEIIAREDAVIPCTAAMRSRHIDVRREGARIVANLSASSDKFAVDAIINANGHHLLASFLVSQDDGFQRVGAIGIGNMCTHDHHRVTLMKAGVLEPLSSLARSTKTELDIRRVAMLAIANLAACFSNHDDFINQRTIPMLVSFSNSEDPGIRNYAAFTISELSKNPDMMEAITEAGGLEPVLYLARSDDKKVQRDILTALTTLSFLDRNKSPICMNGALPPIIDCINEGQNGTTVSKLACSAIANMIESTDNMQLIVNHGCVPLLISALESESESVRRESARAIGNLAVSIEYCDMILELGASRRLMSCFQRRNSGCQRFASMALGNVSSNVKSHSELMENNILGLMRNECLVFLDPKQCSDHETVRYCLLIISNMAVAKRSHSFMVDFYDILMDFTRDRDAKCRQYAILALGNLCADPLQVESLIDAKCSNAMILFSFPPTTEDARSAQFQAIAGLHGLSKIHEYRTALLREGSLEPLILGVRGNSKFSDSEIQHEAAAALSNLSLEEPNRILIAKSGALPALVTLLNEASTSICKVHAVTALANLAESSDEVHTLLINERCIQPLCELVQNQETHTNIKQSASRCFALFASNTDTHRHLLTTSVIASIKILLSSTRDTTCERFGALTVANLALCESNHSVLLKTALLESLLLLHNSGDVETLRGIAFALHSFSKRNENHCALEDANVIKFLPTLMDGMDEDTAFQACLATKFLCQCDRCRNTFSDSCGLKPLLNLVSLDNTEMKQEAAATLWNISLSDKNKNIIMNENGLDIISTLCRSSENELSYLACGIIANISESHENKIRMVKGGIIHHLQYAMLPKSTSVNRESIRAFANLSAAKENIVPIANSGALTNLIEALQSPDALTRRFAAMTMSNLASCEQNIYRIFHEHGIVPLISILRQVDISKNDMCLQQHAMACLANLASCHVLQHDLIEFGCLQLSMEHMKCSNVQLRTYALHCFSNFASNRNTHFFLQTRCTVQELIGNLRCRENQIKLYTAKSLHGLSSDSYFRREIISNNGVEALLPLIQSDDTEVKNEALSTLCNLSLGGFLGDRANNVLQKIDMQSLIGFVRNKDSIYRLFGAVAIGNIASHDNFKSTILDSGALQPLLGACGESSTDIETRRCIALAVCNLASNVTNRSPIINQGGLASIIFLCQSGVSEDMLVALTTLRGFASSASDRRLVFEEGTLSVLSLAMTSGCIECKRESASILALLSLNEENKSDLARSNDIKDFLVLAEGDDYCTKQICRAVGNVCEVVDLHYDLLHFVSVDQLIHLSSHKQESVRVEVSRCFANLSSNCKVHNLLATPKVFANLISFCSSTDVDTSRYAVLSLANLCLCKNTRLTLEKQELVSGLCQVFKHEPLLTEAQKLDTVAYLKRIETKCYSCMAAIALSTDVFVVRRFIKYGMIPAIIPLLHIGCAELNLYISFLLSKLTSVKSSFDEIVQYRLIEQMQGCNFDTAAQTYYITSLRRLSSDEITRGELDIGTIEFLADSITFENIERCREISASICFLALRDSAKISIMENKTLFSHLLEMCKSSDPEICRFALGSLANIADDVRLHSSLKKMGSLVEFLLRLMENGVVSIVRESSRAMSNLLTSMDTQQEFLKEDGMSVLLDVSKSADKECIYNTSVALRKLASNCFAHIYFFDQNGIEVVMDLSKHDEQDVRIHSATALRDISSNTEFKLRFVESGAMETVFTYFSSDAVMLKILAMDTLRNLSLSMRLKGTLLRNDVVNLTGECITHSNNDKDLLFRCASLIANIAEHAQNKVLLVRMGILRQLVNLCKCTFKSVKMEAARAFSLLSSAPENVDIFDSMIVSTIVGLLDCEEKSACRDSIAAISNIATSHEKVLLIGNCGGVHLLIPFLESPQRDCQRNACIALSRLTVLDKNKRAALNRGGLESLLRLSDSRNEGISQMSLMVLCNLCSLKGYGTKFVNHSVLPRLKRHLTSGRLNSRRYVAIAICNLTSQFSINDHIARQINIVTWIEMMNDADVECRVHAIMVLGNLAAEKSLGSIILKSKVLPSLMSVLATEIDCRLHRAALVALYNISTCEISHTQFEKENSTTLILKSCSSDCALCRRLALMILSNVSCNAITRDSATRNGGLQTTILAVKDKDMTCKRIACICLANMGNSSSAQAQIVVHGGLSALMSLSQVNDGFSREFAFMCLSNLAANKSNHDPLIKQGVFNASIESFKSSNSLGIYHMFSIANLISKSEGLSRIGKDSSFKSLLMLSNSSTIHSRCLALSSLRRLATIRVAREMMMIENVIQVITRECNVTQTETSKEISSCLFNLTLDRSHRVTIAEAAMSKLVVLAESNDLDTIRLSVGAIGNLAEEIDIHPIILSACAQSVVFLRLSHPSIDVKREATRACANLLSSKEVCAYFVVHGVDDLAVVSSSTKCEECCYYSVLSFRKLCLAQNAHQALIEKALRSIIGLLGLQDLKTRKHTAAILRDLSASCHVTSIFLQLGIISTMVELLEGSEKDLQIFAMSCLRHLSDTECIAKNLGNSRIMRAVKRCLFLANEDMKCQIAGLFANISEYRECHPVMIADGVISGISELSLTDNKEIWQDCARSFANLCSHEGKQLLIYRKGCVKTLVKLSSSKCPLCQRYVAIAMRFIVSSVEVQNSLSKDNEFAPFIVLSNSKFLDFVRSSSSVMATMSETHTGQYIVLKNGGMKSLLRLINHSDFFIQREAMRCVANFAGSHSFRQYVVKEGGVETVTVAATTCGGVDVLRDSARAFSSFSIDNATRSIMIAQEVSKVIFKLSKSSDSQTQRFAALALCNMCLGTLNQRETVVKQGVLRVLLFLLRYPDVEIERCAALSIASLSLGSIKNKTEIMKHGFIAPLISTTTYPDKNIQRCAVLALNGVALGESTEPKISIYEEGHLSSLIALVKSEDVECIHTGIYLLGTLAENMDIRNFFVSSNAFHVIVEKLATGSIEVKRAASYLLCLLSECKEYHYLLESAGALEQVVAIASLVDEECEECGAFSLALLARNKSFQVKLTNMGAVRPLVSMMARNSASEHYAADALVQISNNRETHVRLAEDGGIQALLKLGQGKVAAGRDDLQDQAKISVGDFAKAVSKQL